MENTQAPQEEIKLGPVCKFFKKYTLDGEVLIEQNQETGEYREYPLKTEDLLPLPPAFKVSHASEMALFHSLLVTIKKDRPKREIPATRLEYRKAGADPRIVNQLVTLGLLEEDIIPLLKPDGTNPGSRACIYYTPQGRAYIRAKIDPNYALTEYR